MKAKILEEEYEANLEFPERGGSAIQKTFRGEISMDIFLNCTLACQT